MRSHFVAGGLLTLALGAAQAEAISPDRPGAGNGAGVVEPGTVQLETGLAGERDTGVRSLGLPWLLRLGVAPGWELRLDSDGYQRLKEDGARSRGWNDLGLGAKWELAEGVALLGHLSFATGSGAFRGQGTRPEIDLAMDWDLPAGYSLSLMPGVYRERDEQGRGYWAGVLGFSLGRALNEKTQAFVELAAPQLASTRNGGSQFILGAGLTRLLSDDVQIDTALSRGLNKRTPDWQWTVGLSVRF